MTDGQKRKIDDVQKDLDYVRSLEDCVTIFLIANRAHAIYKRALGEDAEAKEKVNDATLEYWSKLKEIRQQYEKEREGLLRPDKYGEK